MPIHGVITYEAQESGAVIKLGRTLVPERAVYAIAGRGGSPSLRVEFEMRDEAPICVSVHFDADTQGRGILTGDLTTLPSLNRLAVEVFAELSGGMMSTSEEAALDELDVTASIRAKTRAQFAAKTDRDARRSAVADIRGDAELREVARVYRENLSEHPTEAVQDFLGLTRRTASRRIQQARAKGYLPPTTQGRKNA
ncbi:hypothetical protein [Microbacterium deminutum]|uniref:Uncharacterized protein n=1 Tax=Microbacterium deminutum TaxID=344164 RepID=A0ABN2QF79_9MICO